MRRPSRSLDYIAVQVAAAARWLVARQDVLDYIIVAPHDGEGISGRRVIVQSEKGSADE